MFFLSDFEHTTFHGQNYRKKHKRRGKPLRYNLSSLRDLPAAKVLPDTNIRKPFYADSLADVNLSFRQGSNSKIVVFEAEFVKISTKCLSFQCVICKFAAEIHTFIKKSQL